MTALEASAPAPARARIRDPWQRLPAPLRYALVLVVLLAVWQTYVALSHVSPLLVGSPVERTTKLPANPIPD